MTKLLALGLLVALNAFAACNPEAEFFGKVKNVKRLTLNNNVMTTFQIKLTGPIRPSMLCPLQEQEIEAATLSAPGERLKNGDEISGIIVLDQATGIFHIE